MIKTLQRRFALSRQGAVDLIKGCVACVLQDISFMLPVGLLYTFVIDTMNGGVNGSRIAFYGVGALVCLCLRSVYKELHADHETGAADNK